MIVSLLLDGVPYRVRVSTAPNGRPQYAWAREDEPFRSVEVDLNSQGAGELSMLLADSTSMVARLDRSPAGDELVIGGKRYAIAAYDPRSLTARRGALDATTGPATLASPMPGRIVRILCPPGTPVAAKQGVLMVEAMKMQNELKSPRAGVVTAVMVKEGDSVTAGQSLALIS